MGVEAYLNDNSFKYILLNNEGKFSIIKHSRLTSTFGYNIDINSVENIKQIDDNFQFFDGIIFVNAKKNEEKENIKRINDFISRHNDEIESKYFFPIIVIGNNIDLLILRILKKKI